MRIHRNMYQTKEQEKNSSKELNGTEISNLPDKEFKTMVIKMLNNLGRANFIRLKSPWRERAFPMFITVVSSTHNTVPDT